MNVAVVYETSTGTTARAAEAMGRQFAAQGHQCQVLSVSKADPAAVAEADLLCLGGWVQGLLVIGQHPSGGIVKYIDRFDSLQGKEIVVFCTYKIAAGSTLSQLAKAVERKGGIVVGRFQFRGPAPDGKFGNFAQALR